MKSTLYVGRLAGVELHIHSTFPLILLWSFWRGWTNGGLFIGFTECLLILTLFGCVALHELGHSLVARFFGIGTQRIVLYPIGGVASLDRIPSRPHQELLMALGGPAVNLAIAGGLSLIGGGLPRFDELAANPITLRLWVSALIASNLALAIFNLIPAFPMDGGRVFRSFLAFFLPHSKATSIAFWLGIVVATGLAVVGIFSGNPFLIVIALFIGMSGRQENNSVQLLHQLDRHIVADIMQRNPLTLGVEEPLSACLQKSSENHRSDFIVLHEGRIVGLLPDHTWRASLRTRGPNTPAGTGMDTRFAVLSPQMTIGKLASLAQSMRQSFFPVLEGGIPIGIITSGDLAQEILRVSPRHKRSPSGWRIDLG